MPVVPHKAAAEVSRIGSREISQQRDRTAKRSHSKESSQWGKSRFLREVSHESFVFTSSASDFEGGLAQKLRFHIFNFQILREVSHESFVFTSSTSDFEGSFAQKLCFHIFHFRFWGRPRTKPSHSHLQLSLFEGSLARKLRFHIFNFQILREVSHKSFVFTSSTFTSWGKSRTKCVFKLQFLTFLRVVLSRFATQPLRIAV